jgi:proline iminopeptidase
MPYAVRDGVRLYYEVDGSGVPCIVPDGAGSQYYQRSFSAALRQRLQLVFLALRGGGASDRVPLDTLTLDDLVADIEAVRQHLGHERIVIMGHSMHGLLPVLYAHAHPAHCAGAILVATVPRADATVPEGRRQYWEMMASAERRAVAAERAAQLATPELRQPSTSAAFVRRYVLTGYQSFYDPRYDCSWLWDGAEFDVGWPVRFMAQFGALDAPALYPQVRCPLFIASGRYDFGCPPTLWEGEWQRFPHATFQVFERSGHVPQLEEPAAFDATLSAWLATAGLSATASASSDR